MEEIRITPAALGAGAIVVVLAAATGGYWVAASQDRSGPSAAMFSAAAEAQPVNRAPLYYQDPDGKPLYSAVPRKTPNGRDYRPVYADNVAVTTSPAGLAQPAAQGKGRILYYRNPMGLPDTSPVPKKDNMGMAYIPVYENEAPSDSGIVQVSPGRLQMLGVTTAPVEMRADLSGTVRATAVVQPDESKLAAVTTKFDGVVEKMFVSTTGAEVHAGQPLAQVWIQIPDKMMQAGPDLITREVDYLFALKHNDSVMAAESARILRDYGIPDSTLDEIRRTGRGTRSITVFAPRDGVVLDKPAIEGMHFNTGDPLFKIVDLSTVWLIADIQEQDLGTIRQGAPVQIGFTAYPGRTFSGKVDFIYPTVDPATRTGKLRIVVPNLDGALRDSMYATVSIGTQSAGRVLAVPDSAVIDSGTRQVVFIDHGQGRFEPREVKVGKRGNGEVQIIDGVKAGERVVTSANFLIDAESNLRAVLSDFAAAKPAGTPLASAGKQP